MSKANPPKRSRVTVWASSILVLPLLVKFLLPLFRFPIPLGYDPGIYRYLFLKYAASFPLFPDLPRWAGEHPPGLFLLAAPFLRMGIPVEWFLGWIWNLFPVFLATVLALSWRRKEGVVVGVLVLLTAFLSQAYYDGFVGMYWKTYAALLFTVFTFTALEKKSWLALLFTFLTLIIHHQTGLLLGLSIGTWWLLSLKGRLHDKRVWMTGGALACIALFSLLFYLPHWIAAVRDPFTSIYNLRGDLAPGGSFPDPVFYLRITAVLLALGAWGFLLSWRKERGSLWQLAVLWTLPFIIFRLVFYRRFFLQCDFFLLPFAAMGIRDLWQRFRAPQLRIVLVVLILVQAGISLRVAWERIPALDMQSYAAIQKASAALPRGDAPVIALDNAAARWLLGELLDRNVGGPGIFDLPGWKEEQWAEFLYGTHEQREVLLRELPQGTLFILTPLFTQYYGEYVTGFLIDPCFTQVQENVMKSVCGK
ncbi:MAG: hypothetical protein Greene101449_379 [Candidatus Peregrinibacteria bacterium Greene1014_49]|nr:MAG: hypothetical protein Greene101449_379 [Candidatus Peregrinibacteria bacterium Greene1014_49]